MRILLPYILIIIIIGISNLQYSYAQEIKIGTGRTNRTLHIGDSISIWWNVTDANKFSCAELEELDLPMDGKLFVSPKQTTSYVFVAERGKTSKSKRITIEVVNPELTNFTIPEKINDEGTYSISWQSIHADYVTISGIKDKLPTEGKVEFKSTRDTTIFISACNKAGYCDKHSKKVKVSYIEFIKCIEKVGIGNIVKVDWKYKNAYKISITGISDSLPPIGNINIPMKDSYSYEVLIYRNNGTIDESFFNVQVIQPKILFFNGNNVVRPDEEVNLSWACENVDSVTLSINKGGKLPLKGKYSFKPEQDGEVTLKAWLNGFCESRTMEIEINTLKQ